MVPTLCTLALLAGPALALDVSASLVSWSDLGLDPGGLDAAAGGPQHLAVGPDGRLALHDSVMQEVVLLDAGRVQQSFAVPRASDLLLLDDGVLVLDHAGRTLDLRADDGAVLSSLRLPDLVPTGVTLALGSSGGGASTDDVLAVDIFGNLHPVAQVDAGRLLPTQDATLRPPALRVEWDGHSMHAGDDQLDLPDAIKASGQPFGDWLVVDVVTAEGPLTVRRFAWHRPTGQQAPLPVQGRVYAPRGDVAAGPDGRLVVMVPWPEGLELLEVRP